MLAPYAREYSRTDTLDRDIAADRAIDFDACLNAPQRKQTAVSASQDFCFQVSSRVAPMAAHGRLRSLYCCAGRLERKYGLFSVSTGGTALIAGSGNPGTCFVPKDITDDSYLVI